MLELIARIVPAGCPQGGTCWVPLGGAAAAERTPTTANDAAAVPMFGQGFTPEWRRRQRGAENTPFRRYQSCSPPVRDPPSGCAAWAPAAEGDRSRSCAVGGARLYRRGRVQDRKAETIATRPQLRIKRPSHIWPSMSKPTPAAGIPKARTVVLPRLPPPASGFHSLFFIMSSDRSVSGLHVMVGGKPSHRSLGILCL